MHHEISHNITTNPFLAKLKAVEGGLHKTLGLSKLYRIVSDCLYYLLNVVAIHIQSIIHTYIVSREIFTTLNI